MSNNYDDVCAICGQAVHTDTMYYCCPECQRKHKKQKEQDGHDAAKATFIAGSESLKEKATCSDIGIKSSHG
jgi:hypothetical protein